MQQQEADIGNQITVRDASNISDEQMAEFKQSFDPNGDGRISFAEFVQFKAEEASAAETKDDLIEQFRLLAGGAPHITPAQLSELEPELAAYCQKNMFFASDGPEGALDYVAFAESCYGDADV